jgi:hypothetical protein
MTLWLARDTVDEDSHQREGAVTTPTSADKQAVHNSTPPHLLDGGQGKLTTTAYPQGVAGLCTESRYGDKDNGDLKREDDVNSNNNRGSTDSMRKDTDPINHGNQIQT